MDSLGTPTAVKLPLPYFSSNKKMYCTICSSGLKTGGGNAKEMPEDDEGVSAGELDEDGIGDEKEEVRGEAATALATFFAGGGREVVVGATERTDEAEDDDEKGETVADSGVGELAFVWDADDWPGSSPV